MSKQHKNRNNKNQLFNHDNIEENVKNYIMTEFKKSGFYRMRLPTECELNELDLQLNKNNVQLPTFWGSFYRHLIKRTFGQFFYIKTPKKLSPPSAYFGELILPRKDAESVIEGLEYLYEHRFLPRYGARCAKWLFHIEIVKAAFSTRWAGIRKFLLEWRHKPTRK